MERMSGFTRTYPDGRTEYIDLIHCPDLEEPAYEISGLRLVLLIERTSPMGIISYEGYDVASWENARAGQPVQELRKLNLSTYFGTEKVASGPFLVRELLRRWKENFYTRYSHLPAFYMSYAITRDIQDRLMDRHITSKRNRGEADTSREVHHDITLILWNLRRERSSRPPVPK